MVQAKPIVFKIDTNPVAATLDNDLSVELPTESKTDTVPVTSPSPTTTTTTLPPVADAASEQNSTDKNSELSVQSVQNRFKKPLIKPSKVLVRKTKLQSIHSDLSSDDEYCQFRGILDTIKHLQILLDRDGEPDLHSQVLPSTIVPLFAKFLVNKQYPAIQNRSMCVVSLMTVGGEQMVQQLVDGGIVETLVGILRSPPYEISEDAITCLGNIAEKGWVFRDFILNLGALPLLMSLAHYPTLQAHVSYALFSLRLHPENPPLPEEVQELCELTSIVKLVMSTNENDVDQVCSALTFLKNGKQELIEKFVSWGVVPILVELLGDGRKKLVTTCLATVAKIVALSVEHATCVVEADAFFYLAKLLKSGDREILKEVLSTVLIFADKNISLAEPVIRSGLVPALVALISKRQLRVQKEAVKALASFSSAAQNKDYITHLLETKAIPAMCEMLKLNRWQTVLTSLSFLESILKTSKKMDLDERITAVIKECGGGKIIAQLHFHNNSKVVRMASLINDTYMNAQAQNSASSVSILIDRLSMH